MLPPILLSSFFFFNDTATTEIYTLSLHDALPIYQLQLVADRLGHLGLFEKVNYEYHTRSEEHTSELQSPCNLVCRLLLEKKKKKKQNQLIMRKKESINIIEPRVYTSKHTQYSASS